MAPADRVERLEGSRLTVICGRALTTRGTDERAAPTCAWGSFARPFRDGHQSRLSDPSPHRYLQDGLARGAPEDALHSAVRRAAASYGAGSDPILSLRHLAHLSGAPYLYLREIVQRRRDPYVDILRPKRTGGSRLISAPEPVLMDVQRLILQRALRRDTGHPASFAYRQGRSIVMCAQRHVGMRWMLKFDLHDFFGQVDEHRVWRIFDSLGYAPLVSLELARLCTRAPRAPAWPSPRGRYRSIPSYDVGVVGHLPQGAPTSGALANAVATPLDAGLHELASQSGYVYSRYSDDLVLSSTDRFDRQEAKITVGAVRDLVLAHGFDLHRKKTRVIPPGARHIVLGLLVGDDSVRLTPEFRRRVETHVRGVERFGLAEHAQHRRFRSVLSFINHVEGCLAFSTAVEPVWAAKVGGEWRAALRATGYPI